MSFEIVKVGEIKEMVEVDVRLCRTEDDRLVEETNPEARWLYCIPGQKIPKDEAIKYGLIKEQKPPANKARKASENKGA